MMMACWGRGSPLKRDFASELMTAVGGLGHALPYLIADFGPQPQLLVVVVFVELWAIAGFETAIWRPRSCGP